MSHKTPVTLGDRVDQKVFDAIYSRALVYNTCWEDPAIDRQALAINATDHMLVITSAGCNVLDYALVGPERIHAIDANPRQNALLELKLAGIRALAFEDFFAAFGHGYHPDMAALYARELRPQLSDFARAFWDKRIRWFGHPRGSFYFHGLSGTVARAFHAYLKIRPRLAASIQDLFATRSLEEQRHVYDTRVDPLIWTKGLNWTLSRQFTMSMLGVPHPQRKEVQQQHDRGVAGFVREAIGYVFRQLPIWTNYFWTLYIHGRYTETCCPEYLKADNFSRLKAGAAECIALHTCTVTDFLKHHEAPISKFVLLDHMDWMSSYEPEALADEWEWILARARADARLIFRSAHAAPAYLESLELGPEGRSLAERLRFYPELAAELQTQDRVHTYAGFHIADVCA
jgi:S-adenosylmethionine-diacylglycerol 3-amino-3-carboxypropyl transferase